MADNFHGVLIFPPMKINAYSDMQVYDDGRGHKHVAARPTLPCISKQLTVAIVIQLMASSTLIFFYLMLFVQVSVDMA